MEEHEFRKRIGYANIMLKEYDSLRSEIIQKQSLFNNIVNFSFAVISAILASIAALKLEGNQGARYVLIVTGLIIPLVC